MLNARLKKRDKALIWHPFTQMKEWLSSDPLIIERAKGNYLIDTEGRRYLDGVSSLWVNVHGHRKKEIDRAIIAQLKKVAHSTLLGLGNCPSIELAWRLIRIAPKGLEKVVYSDNGSTAVEVALKLSFQYWGQKKGYDKKRRFIAFRGAYHGDTFGSMSVGEIDIFVEKYRPLLFDVVRAPYPYCYRCPVGKDYLHCGLRCLDVFEEKLKKHHNELAACIIEPLIQGAAGMITAPRGFLKAVRGLTKKYNIHLVADEVATGFGRTGRMFACGHEGVSPDMMCLAKGITGGYMPLAATLVTDEIYNAFLGGYSEFKAFFHGHTYTGNPLACSAALASLDVFEKEKVLERLKPKIKLLKTLLKDFWQLEHVGDIRSIGLIAGIELVADRRTKNPFPSEKRLAYNICMDARQKGLILRSLGDTIVIMPPLSIKETELVRICRIVFEYIKKRTEKVATDD
ncbi:MAG: adenosylmethionine--8-amino-7-oxononanoate transaminase [Deltaproteobacteria bacterium]|nr:adenosylmethionine--8-amino-7-oxononanoate transaminase [Deltaproteobacteria bacterium]